MAKLAKYNQKRKFDHTPEPRGTVEQPGGRLRFVVQKHAATRLHYDFRLELDGVLKSWAVPKGPSLNPADKRLAMMVEDHPYNYKDFEGTIPKGNYGAGEVIVWDEGTYRPAGNDLAAFRQGFQAGKVAFTLEGQKLRGEFTLFKLKGGEENAWILMKHQDEFADTGREVTEADRSVKTGRTLADLKTGQPAASPLGVKAPIPKEVKPMLATLTDGPFDRDGWLFEIKWDGYRAIAEVEKGQVRLYSRNNIDFNVKYPVIADELKKLRRDLVLDGEIVVVDESGMTSFQLLQQYTSGSQGRLAYYVFDILWLDGHDLRQLPLVRRKEILRTVFKNNGVLRYSDHVEHDGVSFFDVAVKNGLEGIMAKDGQSPYQAGVRGEAWLKIKTRARQEAVICGFTEPRGSRSYFGALVLGVYEDSELRYVGHSGSGFNEKSLALLTKKLEPITQPTSPFKKAPKTNMPVTWVEPKYVCEIEFHEWTADGIMRQPIFLGLREDKAAREVKRELSVRKEKAVQKKVTMPPKVPTTNLDKVYWPDENYTKGDLIVYYEKIAETMLPYLKDRPQNLHRHPNGIKGASFYQRDIDSHPDWVETVSIRSEEEDKETCYVLVQNPETLIYLANLGCIEINPWNTRVKTINYPDYLAIDLDPEDIDFEKVVETALVVKEVFDDAGLPSYCKTSGSTGLHIFVPMGAKYPTDMVKQFAELIANLVHQRCPEFTSIERSPSKRQKKVYVDYLQNRAHQSLASVYSVRPKPGATVSTPLDWAEVKKGLSPSQFTIKNMPARLKDVGDLWRDVLGEGIDLETALKKLQ